MLDEELAARLSFRFSAGWIFKHGMCSLFREVRNEALRQNYIIQKDDPTPMYLAYWRQLKIISNKNDRDSSREEVSFGERQLQIRLDVEGPPFIIVTDPVTEWLDLLDRISLNR